MIQMFSLIKDPFIIHVENLHHDFLFPNILACPYYSEARSFYEKLTLFNNKEYVKNLLALKEALPPSDKIDAESNFTSFRDDILARQVSVNFCNLKVILNQINFSFLFLLLLKGSRPKRTQTF